MSHDEYQRALEAAATFMSGYGTALQKQPEGRIVRDWREYGNTMDPAFYTQQKEKPIAEDKDGRRAGEITRKEAMELLGISDCTFRRMCQRMNAKARKVYKGYGRNHSYYQKRLLMKAYADYVKHLYAK